MWHHMAIHAAKWLHENRSEEARQTRWTVSDPSKWFHENRTEGYTEIAMEDAAEQGLFDLLLFLHGTLSMACIGHTVSRADTGSCLEILQWLLSTTQSS